MSKSAVRVSVLVAIVILLVGGLVWYWSSTNEMRAPQPSKTANDSIAEPAKPADVQESTLTVTSLKGVELRLYNWPADSTFTTPLTLSGEVPGNWSFEASFPVVLTDWDGKIIAEKPAALQGDWMTDQYVPFTVTLTFEAPTFSKTGSLILRKDNPSGLSANDDAAEIIITYK